MTNKLEISRELERLAERYEETARGPSPGWIGAEVIAKELRALLAAPVVERQEVQVAAMPVERCYDIRVKMIMAFNEAKKNGGDLDDALDAAYKSALRFSPNPLIAEQPAPVAVVLPERAEFEALQERFDKLTEKHNAMRTFMRRQSKTSKGRLQHIRTLTKELNQ